MNLILQPRTKYPALIQAEKKINPNAVMKGATIRVWNARVPSIRSLPSK